MTLTLTQDEARRVMERYRRDPLLFTRECLGVDLWGKEAEIMEAVRDNSRTAVESCESSGKSFTDACVLLWFLYSFAPSTALTTAPTLRQVEDVLWKEIRGRWYGAKVPLGGRLLTMELEIDPEQKWFALGLTTTETERFLGYHNENVLVIVDQPAGVSEEIFHAIENPLSSGFTRLLMTGNPTRNEGTFYDACHSPDTPYKVIHIGYQDTPNFRDDIPNRSYLLSPEYVEGRRKLWGEDSGLWQAYILGIPPVEGLDTLIPVSWIDLSKNRDLPRDGGVVIGVDTAREGDDENVAIVRQGPKVLWMEAWHEPSTMVTADKIAALAELYFPVRINVDMAPIGAGVLDRLKQKGLPAVGIEVGQPAKNSHQFVNIRAEMFWRLRMLFQNGEIDIIDDPELIGQLSKLKYEQMRGEQRIIIESKRNMKARGLRSPDRADALALAFYEYSSTVAKVNVVPTKTY